MAQLLNGREVQDVTGFSRTTLWRLRRAGRFPEPVKIGPKANRWRREDMDAYMKGLGSDPPSMAQAS